MACRLDAIPRLAGQPMPLHPALWSSSAVRFPATSNADDQNQEHALVDFVDDSIVAYTNAAHTCEFAFQRAARMRLGGKAVDHGDDPCPIRRLDPAERFSRAGLDLYRVAHASPRSSREPRRRGR